MTAIPENVLTQADLDEWARLNKELKAIKDKEMLLRKKIFSCCFKDPVEGTNTFNLADGWAIKGKYVLNRKPDIALINNRANDLRTVYGINLDQLIKWSPELALSEYRKLTDEQRKVVDDCLTITEGSPSIEVVQSKRKGG